MSVPLAWDEFVDAARRCGWTAFLGTADDQGRPTVAVVAPGFADGALWFASWASARKVRNLRVNSAVALHWPLAEGAPGEVAAWGTATLHEGDDERRRLWTSGVLPYDPASFFRSPDGPMVFVEVAVTRARLLTADHVTHVWRP